MKIRRYTCRDMQEALLKVKMDLGSEAVIMNSKKVRQKGILGWFSKPMIEVVAAIDDDYVRPSRSAYASRQQSYPAFNQSSADPAARIPRMSEDSSRVSAAVVAEPAVAEAKALFSAKDDPKIALLENKVKNMESMLTQIYKAVNKNEADDNAEPSAESADINNEQTAKANAMQRESNAKSEAPARAEAVNSAAPTASAVSAQTVNNAAPAVPTAPSAPAAPVSSAATAESANLAMLRELLFERDVEPRLIEKILEKIKERGGNSMSSDEVFGLAARVMTVLLGEPEPLTLREDKKPHVVILLGPTGVGKTTTLAKIAADFTLNKQKKVGLITADTYRIAAVEQLKTYAEILNLQVNVVYSPSEIKGAIEKLSDNDLILIDTAGRSHRNKAHFDELKMLVNVVNADETYLVVSCNTSRAAIREILEYYAFIRNYKLLFTKLDESPVPGIILNARYMTGKPLSYTTAGQSVPDDLNIADVKQLVASILGRSQQ